LPLGFDPERAQGVTHAALATQPARLHNDNLLLLSFLVRKMKAMQEAMEDWRSQHAGQKPFDSRAAVYDARTFKLLYISNPKTNTPSPYTHPIFQISSRPVPA
jgi:hypothetical protein